MRNILLFGAGRSASTLISYLLEKSNGHQFVLTVADADLNLAIQKTAHHPHSRVCAIEIEDAQQRSGLIAQADLVISLLPPALHILVARDCIRFSKNLCTASYVSDDISQLHGEAIEKGIVLMNECGLDPGLDHMSAMKIIDEIHNSGHVVKAFKSYTGGLVAPEFNDNPWGYKFTWNPQNVILAGQGTATYLRDGKLKHVPYNRLFLETEQISVDGFGMFEGYANRDSLMYSKLYNLPHAETLIRGTLRNVGYCSSWNIFVRLGLTDNTTMLSGLENVTYHDFLQSFIPASLTHLPVEEQLASIAGIDQTDERITKVLWTGINADEKITLTKATPAQVLQQLLEKKWKLQSNEKDMIVMQHQIEFENSEGMRQSHVSSLVVKGDNSIHTAMSKTVGLPLAITALKILNREIKLTGVHIPVAPQVYNPVLDELEHSGIVFN